MRGKGLLGVGKGTAGRDAGFLHERQPEKKTTPRKSFPLNLPSWKPCRWVRTLRLWSKYGALR